MEEGTPDASSLPLLSGQDRRNHRTAVRWQRSGEIEARKRRINYGLEEKVVRPFGCGGDAMAGLGRPSFSFGLVIRIGDVWRR